MRVAFVTARPPYPLNTGGRIRTFHLLKQISRIHDVTLITAAEGAHDHAALAGLRDALAGCSIKAVEVPPRRAVWRRPSQVTRMLWGPLPYTWAGYCSRQFQDYLRTIFRDATYDLVHCDHVQVAHAFAGFDTAPRVLNAHNIESVLIRRMADHAASPWRKALVAWQAAKTHQAEAEAHRGFHRSIVVSEVDQAALEQISPGQPITVVPNGVDADYFQPAAVLDPSPAIVFVGSMDWLPNIDAVNVFVRRVLPRIRQDVPDATLWVVGRTPPRSMARGWAGEGVRVTGTVGDVRPYIARARLVVVPLRIAGGTRLKILEAWAMGKPVLSTAVGAEGLPAVDGENIALADSPDDMAVRAVMLLKDASTAAGLGARGRRMVEEQFTWSRVAGRLLQAYEETVAPRRVRTPELVGRSSLC